MNNLAVTGGGNFNSKIHGSGFPLFRRPKSVSTIEKSVYHRYTCFKSGAKVGHFFLHGKKNL